LREYVETIEKKGVSIVTVVPTESVQIKQYIDVYGPYPFKILGDPNQYAYRGLHLKHLSKGKSLKIMLKYLFSGRLREIFPKDSDKMNVVRKSMLSQDVYQLGGTWVIDTSGKILWQHIDSEPDDHATISTILSVLEKNN
jgi:peroxiredoxin